MEIAPSKSAKVRNSYGKNGLGSGSAEAKNVFDGDGSTGWSTAQREGEAHQLVLVLDEPLRVTESLKIEMLFERHYATSLGRFRWSVCTSDKTPTAQDTSGRAANRFGQRTIAMDRSGTQATRTALCVDMRRTQRRSQRNRSASQVDSAPPTTLVMQERTGDNPRPTHRHHRGEYLSPREEVTGAIPEIFRELTAKPPTNRLELARWLASQDNPLVGRVVVNRAWQSLFGDGLVRSQGDFGMQSSPPTHPELLDWLAVDWMESGWSMKKLLRDIVLSSTYQQSSSSIARVARTRSRESAACKIFTSTSRRRSAPRCDACHQRTAVRTHWRPSVRPPQPASVTALAYGNEAWPESKGADRFRRSLYTFSKRTAPFAAYQAFDAPSGETCAVRRERSNTPLQALTLLNDSMFIEMAEALGCHIFRLQATTTPTAQI